MKIIEQARAALKINPFVKTFVCDKVCSKEGCNSYVRRITGNFDCHECSKKRATKYRKLNAEKVAQYNKDWHNEFREYVNTKRRADYQLKKERKRE